MKLIFVPLLILLTLSASAQNSTLIKTGKFYNAEINSFQKDVQILITNSRIEKIGTRITVPANTKVIECGNCTVTPGLTDMHTHLLYKEDPGSKSILDDGINNSDADRALRAVKVGRSMLKSGFTTVRDLGNSGEYLDVSLKNAIATGRVQGPTVFASGMIISPYGGQTYNLPLHSQHLVDKEYRIIKSVDDAKLAVKEHVRLGVDLIKICSDNTPGNLMLSFDEIKAITETAHEYGLKVTAHATFEKSVRTAVLAGVDGIEHGYDIADSTLDLMAKRGVYLVPTDLTFSGAMKIFKLQNVITDSGYVRGVINSFKQRLIRAHKKGVNIVFGRDYYFNIRYDEGEASKDGLLSYFEAGISVQDVLRSATFNAGVALDRKGRIGVLKEKGMADLVIFDGDLENNFPTTLFKVKAVYKDGKLVD